ncbi:MAG: hypothetical protein AWU54_2245 [Candidatus Frackibacter sp. T328-2]|nr:MAG: hypothetical protein AWU54_2245 [Candidatus Frackibacter sp. T328-2]
MEEYETNISKVLQFIGALSIGGGLLITLNIINETRVSIYVVIPWLVSGIISGTIFFAIAKVINLLNSISVKLDSNYEMKETLYNIDDQLNSNNDQQKMNM